MEKVFKINRSKEQRAPASSNSPYVVCESAARTCRLHFRVSIIKLIPINVVGSSPRQEQNNPRSPSGKRNHQVPRLRRP